MNRKTSAGIFICVVVGIAIVVLSLGLFGLPMFGSGGKSTVDEDVIIQESLSTKSGKTTSSAPRDISTLPGGTVLTAEEVASCNTAECFTSEPIPDEVFARMEGKSYKADCTVPRENLRYLRVLHKNLEGETLVGEIVVNKKIADDIVEIFEQLYDSSYPIEKVRLVDEYDADDTASMADNNTSSFNFRNVPGSSTQHLSNHAYGLAIDINPFYNPYCIPSKNYISPPGSEQYADRSKSFDYKIEETDLLFRLFKQHGFTWGGYWDSCPDYQHFERP